MKTPLVNPLIKKLREIKLEETDIIQQLEEEKWLERYNSDGTDIAIGDIVRITNCVRRTKGSISMIGDVCATVTICSRDMV